MMTRNQQIIARQQELIHQLSWNQAFGCYTRKGFEHVVWPDIHHRARWIVYFDVDGVHALNERAGTYDVFDGMIKQVLSSVRSTDIVAGQLASGDEFLVCVTETPDRPLTGPHGLVERLTAELAKHNLTAIFAVVPVISSILSDNLKPAADQVLAAKQARGSASR